MINSTSQNISCYDLLKIVCCSINTSFFRQSLLIRSLKLVEKVVGNYFELVFLGTKIGRDYPPLKALSYFLTTQCPSSSLYAQKVSKMNQSYYTNDENIQQYFSKKNVVKIAKVRSLLTKQDHFVLHEFLLSFSRVMRDTKTTIFNEKK